MKDLILLSTVFLFAITACEKEDPIPPRPAGNYVNFNSLEEGQVSKYRRYSSMCDAVEDEFEFTGDTLILEVIKEDGQLYLQESLTPLSPLFLEGQFPEPIKHPVTKENDYLLIPQRFNSALFFFYANDTLHLKPTHDVTLYQDNCRLFMDSDPFIGNDIGLIPSFEVGNVKVTDKTVVSCEPFLNLDAYLIYNEAYLYVSHVLAFEGIEGPDVFGWEFLLD